MNENNSDNDILLLRDILNESILRDLIIFVLLYIFILTQSWNDMFFLLFPIIIFTFSMTFRIINTNKWRIYLENERILYNPLGSEKKIADRLFFSSILLLIILFWIGAESIYHPQLIDDYGLYFNVLYIFIYSFGFYWMFIDIWKNANIRISKKEKRENSIKEILSSLGREKAIQLAMLNLFIFIIINGINIIIAVLINFSLFPIISYDLPGTGIDG